MKVLEALRNAASRVQSHVTDSKLFTQMGDRGADGSALSKNSCGPSWRHATVLHRARFLTARATGVARSMCWYSMPSSAPLLLDEKTNLGVFPCESVYACIEVKSDLSSEEIQTAIDNISSVKCLKRREPSDAAQILPHVRLQLGYGLSAGPGVLNPYLGVVFGYKGVAACTALEKLKVQSIDKELLPDFLVCIDPGYVILRLKDDGRAAPLGSEWAGYGIIHTGADTLPLFFLSLNICLCQIRLREPDWNQYWIEVTQPLLANAKSTAAK